MSNTESGIDKMIKAALQASKALAQVSERMAALRVRAEKNPEVQARLREWRSEQEYRRRIAEERRKGREFVKAEAERLCRELGFKDFD